MLLYYPIYDNVITYIYYCILYYVLFCRVKHYVPGFVTSNIVVSGLSRRTLSCQNLRKQRTKVNFTTLQQHYIKQSSK